LKITRYREVRFVMGKYEHAVISGTVEVDTAELGLGFTDQAKAINFTNQLLDDLLAEDVERAAVATLTPEDDTFVDKWKELTDGTNS
jgi:hypothetical protein